jgi:hypothetical protein
MIAQTLRALPKKQSLSVCGIGPPVEHLAIRLKSSCMRDARP